MTDPRQGTEYHGGGTAPNAGLNVMSYTMTLTYEFLATSYIHNTTILLVTIFIISTIGYIISKILVWYKRQWAAYLLIFKYGASTDNLLPLPVLGWVSEEWNFRGLFRSWLFCFVLFLPPQGLFSDLTPLICNNFLSTLYVFTDDLFILILFDRNILRLKMSRKRNWKIWLGRSRVWNLLFGCSNWRPRMLKTTVRSFTVLRTSSDSEILMEWIEFLKIHNEWLWFF